MPSMSMRKNMAIIPSALLILAAVMIYVSPVLIYRRVRKQQAMNKEAVACEECLRQYADRGVAAGPTQCSSCP